MQKIFKVYALLLVITVLSGCAIFKRKPEIVQVNNRVFIVDLAIKNVMIDGFETTLINPYFPGDKAIIISGEKFKQVMGSSVDSITEKEILKEIVDKEV